MLPKKKLPDINSIESSKITSKKSQKKEYKRKETLPNGKKRLPKIEYDEDGRPINPIPDFDIHNIRNEFNKYL